MKENVKVAQKTASSDKVFVLVAVKGSNHRPIREGLIKIVQALRSSELKTGNWKGWILQVRTQAGYKAVPILPIKSKVLTA